MDKKAILAVSFGTSHFDTLEKTIAAIEADLAAALPDRTLFRAFTSGMILRKLEVEGTHIDSVPQALERLLAEGYGDVVVQPTHILNGDEHDKLLALAAPYASKFRHLAFGKPLLTALEDYQALADALEADLPAPSVGAAVLFMGHGTGHWSNAAYAQLEYLLHDRGRRDVVIGTVEGYPGFGEAVRRIKELGASRVELRPLMIVAGDHAKNDLAGEEPDSWKNRLAGEGYAVTCVLKGIGEYPAVRALFCRHAKAALEKTATD